jgi:hypothetical protein
MRSEKDQIESPTMLAVPDPNTYQEKNTTTWSSGQTKRTLAPRKDP